MPSNKIYRHNNAKILRKRKKEGVSVKQIFLTLKVSSYFSILLFIRQRPLAGLSLCLNRIILTWLPNPNIIPNDAAYTDAAYACIKNEKRQKRTFRKAAFLKHGVLEC